MSVKPELTPSMVRQIVGHDWGLILEIGANDGSDTVGFLSEFQHGHVYCWECDPRAIAGWKRRVADHHRATLYEYALSDAAGTATFYQSGGRPPGKQWEHVTDWDKSGSLLTVDRHCDHSPWLRFDRQIKVRTDTLDNWARDIAGEISFAWIDVQGAEAKVLAGARATLPRIRWVYCECDPRPNYHGQAREQDLRNTLPGFRLVSEHGGYNLLFKREVT